MRELVTDVFEVAGILLLVAGAACWTWSTWGPAAALALAGVLLVVASLVLTALAPRPKRPQEPVA